MSTVVTPTAGPPATGQRPARRRRALMLTSLTGWTVICSAALAPGGGSWHFFELGGQTLADLDDGLRAGLHVYAEHPELQIGPLALLVAAPFAAAGDLGLLAVQLLGAATGPLLVWVVADTARCWHGGGRWNDRWSATTVAAGLAFIPVWTYLGVGVTHLDDVLALALTAFAVRAVAQRRPLLAATLLGLAVDAKPWALPFLALLLVFEPRDRIRGALVAGGVVAAAWLPFFLADPATMAAVHFTIPNSDVSALRALGVTDPVTPGWDRAAQAVLGVALAVAAVRRGRWSATVLLVVAARIALDPGPNRYYAAGAALGALVWDLVGSRSRWPWWTVATLLVLFGTRYLPLAPAWHGTITLVFCLSCLLVLWAPATSGRAQPAAVP